MVRPLAFMTDAADPVSGRRCTSILLAVVSAADIPVICRLRRGTYLELRRPPASFAILAEEWHVVAELFNEVVTG